MSSRDIVMAEEHFFRHNIAHSVPYVTPQKVNIFFGKEQCI